MNRMHPVTFVGGVAGAGLPKRVWGFRKYRYLFEDRDDGRHVFKYRRARRGAEYHFVEEFIAPLTAGQIAELNGDM